MCMIETYFQMESIEAGFNQKIIPTNDELQSLTDDLERQQINADCNENQPKTNGPSPSSTDSDSFKKLFRLFAKFGDSKSNGDSITLTNSDKWFKQAKIIDANNKKITTTDTGIYFKQVAKTKKALTLKEYEHFLEKLATVKKVNFVEDIKEKLVKSGPPATNKTTTVVTSGAIERLTDHTKYTGSHKQRFDESGKGRGRIGREDIPTNTSAFKSNY
ncbi:hypothetical protein NH340_JMT05205 [Sarcoptes scabiei]|nr:hypothetical protein NH340_JMT05205 [Sarcoptes scabiei]